RAELGATVEALSHKADVKAQARERAEHAKRQARARAELARTQAREKPAVPLAAGIGVALVALWLMRRRRRS
ncbi:MAG: DUF3618 domain-containing protein, partial [Thermoleophilaceae bacterium]